MPPSDQTPSSHSGASAQASGAPSAVASNETAAQASGVESGTAQMPHRPVLSANDSPRRSIPAGKVLIIGIFGLLLAIVLNSQVLLAEAEQKSFGWSRDLSLAVWEPVEAVSSAVGLHLPRLWADEALNRGVTDDVVEGNAATGNAATGNSATGNATTGDDGATDPSGDTDDGTVTLDTTPDDSAGGTDDSGDTSLDGASSDDASSDGASSDDASSSQIPIPTPDNPLSMWIIGDSLTHFFGEVMVQIANDTDVISAQTESQISSGLSRPDYYDWPARITDILLEEDPDVIVLTLGGNDAQGVTVGGTVLRAFSPAWVTEYSTRVGHIMDLVTVVPNRVLIWGGIPIMKDERFDDRMQQLNAIYEAEAAQRDRVSFVPSRELFSGPDGEYSRYLTDENGQRVDARLNDGIHFSTVGGVLMSELLLEAVGEYVDLESTQTDTE